MNDELIKFRHRYYKLAQPTFTSIRGKAQFKRLKVGNVLEVETPTEKFKARITHLALALVRDMALPFLKADAEYPGFVIGSHQDFIGLLNSFRSPAWAQVTMDSELTVITLEKVTA